MFSEINELNSSENKLKAITPLTRNRFNIIQRSSVVWFFTPTIQEITSWAFFGYHLHYLSEERYRGHFYSLTEKKKLMRKSL